jgi:hypothetical protein
MKSYFSPPRSIITPYALWSAILALHGSWVILTSGFEEKITDEAFRTFLLVFYLGGIAVFALGAFLVWKAQQGRSWGLLLFIIYCLYRSIDYVWGVAAREGIEGMSVETGDWVKGVVIAGVWFILAGYAYYSRALTLQSS